MSYKVLFRMPAPLDTLKDLQGMVKDASFSVGSPCFCKALKPLLAWIDFLFHVCIGLVKLIVVLLSKTIVLGNKGNEV